MQDLFGMIKGGPAVPRWLHFRRGGCRLVSTRAFQAVLNVRYNVRFVRWESEVRPVEGRWSDKHFHHFQGHRTNSTYIINQSSELITALNARLTERS